MILVLDKEPEECNKCPCMKLLDNDSYCTKDLENFRKIDVGGRYCNIYRPDWCPLIYMPERNTAGCSGAANTEELHFAMGWNQALDAIGYKDEEGEADG